MSTTNERRNKRERERIKIKIHKQFQDKMKGKTNGEVLQELERIRVKYGIEYVQQDRIGDNLIIDPVDVNI
jgi:ribulose bisphosphate carboxylase small subunit